MDKRVLFVGGGRRVALCKVFQEHGYEVFSYELDTNCPISKYAHITQGKPWSESDEVFFDLQNLADLFDINMIIPLQDAAVPIVSRFRTSLALPDSTRTTHLIVPVPYEKEANICLDKAAFAREFTKPSLREYYPFPVIDSPVVFKPARGFGSKGIKYELFYTTCLYDSENYIAQRRIYGKEYSVDCYFTVHGGKFIGGVPRERTRVADGEVISSITVEDKELVYISKLIGEGLGLCGPVNMQYIVEETTGKVYIIEVNCRFGGGSTLAMAAGLDIIKLIESDYRFTDEHYKYEPDSYTVGLRLERAFVDHFFKDNK